VFFIVGCAVLGLWTVSVVVRVAWVALDFWALLGFILLAPYPGWQLLRTIRGKPPTVEEATAFLGGKVVNTWYAIFWGGIGGGLLAALIAVIELNGTFSRQAFDRAVGEYPAVFWVTVSAGVVIGLGATIGKLASSGKAPTTAERATEAKTQASEAGSAKGDSVNDRAEPSAAADRPRE
jgi:hypothetical protein